MKVTEYLSPIFIIIIQHNESMIPNNLSFVINNNENKYYKYNKKRKIILGGILISHSGLDFTRARTRVVLLPYPAGPRHPSP